METLLPQQKFGEKPFNTQALTLEDFRVSFLEQRINDFVARLRKEVSEKVMFGRCRLLASHSGFNRHELQMVFKILEERGVIKKNCICIHVLPEKMLAVQHQENQDFQESQKPNSTIQNDKLGCHTC